MKILSFILAFIIVLFLNFNCFSQAEVEANELKLEKVSGYEKLYKHNNWYFSGQPTLEQFDWLKGDGLITVINLRSKDENKEFSKTAFSEKDLMKSMKINYFSIDVKGKKGFNTKNMEAFTKALNASEGKVLVHCKEAGRVTYFMMAYLMQEKGFSEQEAIAFGEQLTYFSPLDALLEKNP